MSFIQNLRSLVVGKANDLLNAKIDENSPTVLRQNIRDLEEALDQMRNNAAAEAGALKTLTREAGDLQSKIDNSTAVIAEIMKGNSPNKEAAARLRATDVVMWKKMLTEKNARITEQQTTSAQLDDAVTKLQSRHDQLVARVRELERLDRDTKAREQAAKTVEYAGKIVQQGANISIDDIESKMRAKNDVSQVKFDRAMGTLHTDPDPQTSQEVDDLLAQFAPATTTGKATS